MCEKTAETRMCHLNKNRETENGIQDQEINLLSIFDIDKTKIKNTFPFFSISNIAKEKVNYQST